jgi:hypothetical protein
LGRDERVAYVGQGRPRELRPDLAGISGPRDFLDRGQLQVSEIAAMPASDPAADPVDELIDLAASTCVCPSAKKVTAPDVRPN